VFSAGLLLTPGDLTKKIFPKKVTNGALGVTVNYELTPQIMARLGFTYTVVGGADRNSDDTTLRARNLSFETHISEFSLVGEYYFFNWMKSPFLRMFLQALLFFILTLTLTRTRPIRCS
jgi:hypothetical protein